MKKKFNESFKILFLFVLFINSGNLLSQVKFRIQEISVNPNCGGNFCVRENGFCITPIFNYSYPGNINNLNPSNPSVFNSCYSHTTLPDEIQFIGVNLCNNSSFTVPLNGIAVVQSCDCLNLGVNSNHNFTATIQPDPIGDCDYLIIVEY